MDRTELIELSTQKLMLENLLSSPQLFNLCIGIVKPEYFEPDIKPAVTFILDYYNKYNNIPQINVVNSESGLDFEQQEKISTDMYDFCCDKIEQFCKERAVFLEIVNNWPRIAETRNYGELLERITNAVHISLHKDLGTDVLSNVQEHMETRNETNVGYKTGWENVDKTTGGPKRTELWLFSANSGGGKSVALSNAALSFVKQGLNVLYISLELSESMISDRFEQMITAWNSVERNQKVSETVNKVEGLKRTFNASIYVKYLPGDETCCNDIKAYLKAFEVQYGFLPDVLIVDYLDILVPNQKNAKYNNSYDRDKAISTQLRSIGNNPKNPMIMMSASQQNRGAIDNTDVTQGNIAGGLSKVNISDVYISIIMTDSMRAEGIAYFKYLKIRSSDGVGTKELMNWDPKQIMFKSTSTAPVQDKSDIDILKPKDIFAIDEDDYDELSELLNRKN